MIFIDASLIIAILREKDQWHERAIKISKEIESSEKITSDLVIVESITLIAKFKGGKIAKKVYEFIKDNYTIYSTNIKSLDKSINTLLKYDGTLSLVDSNSIDMMKELKITKIASFDSDFDKIKGIQRIF
jgi:predicted nucleic acid-binding protein